MSDLEAISLLHESLRRRLYEYVVAEHREVRRSDVAEATGTPRALVAFHLDKLVDAGLLDVTSRRMSGRSGPGAGRPAKLYRRATTEHQVSLPPRDYRAAAELLAEVAESERLDAAVRAVAHRRGRSLRAGAGGPPSPDEVLAVLAAHGYEPFRDGTDIRLRNCPFHDLSESHPTVVCAMNLALLEGLLDGSTELCARLDARASECCTVVAVSKRKPN